MAMQLNLQEVIDGIKRAGYWFPAVVFLWALLYIINTASWGIIIKSLSPTSTLKKLWLYKVTVAGFALNYATPGGLMGGEAYRISQLTPKIGIEKASSSVILYVMTHIFSHFWFWAFSLLLFVALYASAITWPIALVLLAMAAFCVLGIYFFMLGYRNGLAERALRFFGKWPLIGKRIRRFSEKNQETIQRVDSQIAALHAQRKSTFYLSLFLEFLARVVGCLEVMFILFMLPENTDISFFDCILMQAFMSLFANLMFFIPMEMGTREGGFAMITGLLHMRQANGVLTGLVTRVRELVWIAIGILLMKIGNKKK